MIDFTQNNLYYSPKVLIPTERYDENNEKIPDTEGFYWFIAVQADYPTEQKVTIHVRCAVDDQQAETRTRLIDMPYEKDYQWTDEDCVNYVMSQVLFGGSELVNMDDPNTPEDETAGKPWYKFGGNLNPLKWFSKLFS